MKSKKPILIKYRIRPNIKVEMTESPIFNMPLYADEYDAYINKIEKEKKAKAYREIKALKLLNGVNHSKSRNLIDRYKTKH